MIFRLKQLFTNSSLILATEEEVVIVGSHSGSLHCFSVSKIATLYPWKERTVEEALVWRKQFPSRLESSVVSDTGTYYAYIGILNRFYIEFSHNFS